MVLTLHLRCVPAHFTYVILNLHEVGSVFPMLQMGKLRLQKFSGFLQDTKEVEESEFESKPFGSKTKQKNLSRLALSLRTQPREAGRTEFGLHQFLGWWS